MFNNDDWNEDGMGDHLESLLEKYELLRKGIDTPYFDEEEFEIIIEHFFQENLETEADVACNLALQYYPNSIAINLFKAELLFHSQKLRQAIVILDEIEILDPTNIDIVMLRSEILVAQEKQVEAVKYLHQRLEDFEGKDKIDILLELADVYDDLENHNKIYETLEYVLYLDKRNEEALNKISFWSDFAGFQERTIKLFESILEDDPYNVLAWFNLGVAHQGLKEYEKAIEAYEYCVAIDDSFEFAYRNMADASMRLRWYEKAIEALQRNLELGKPEDIIYEAIGVCFEKQKEFEKARHYYRKAIQLNPADDKLYFKIGETYAKELEWLKALNSYAVATHLNKENAMYYVALGNCLLELEKPDEEVVNSFMQAVKLKPQSKIVWSNFLKALYKMELYESMYENALLVLDLDEDKNEFEYYAVAALLKMGKINEAIIRLGNLLHNHPKKIKILTELDPTVLQRKVIVDLIANYNK
jgi:tetratricopeptide (TPR) repeat protein